MSENQHLNRLKLSQKSKWVKSTEFPDELSPTGRGLSVDVLIYSKQTDEHTVGWYDFNVMTWRFLCREAVGRFKWRYFETEIDKY